MSASSAHRHPETQHPVVLIRAAVLWCRASGVPVHLGARHGMGVHCVSDQAPKWARDHRASGLDPLGAALLNYQPDATDPYEALAECLFAPVAWVRVFEAGLNREDFFPAWAEAPDRMLRAAAYEAGIRYREELIRIRPARAV